MNDSIKTLETEIERIKRERDEAIKAIRDKANKDITILSGRATVLKQNERSKSSERSIEILKLKYIDRKTYKAIALQYGISPSRVRDIVEKGIKTFGYRHNVAEALETYGQPLYDVLMAEYNKR